jgi:hypothetical protein
MRNTAIGCNGRSNALAFPLGLPQHPDEHRAERPVLLAVDQQFGEGAVSGHRSRPWMSVPSRSDCNQPDVPQALIDGVCSQGARQCGFKTDGTRPMRIMR